jgi:hypothetical protein
MKEFGSLLYLQWKTDNGSLKIIKSKGRLRFRDLRRFPKEVYYSKRRYDSG